MSMKVALAGIGKIALDQHVPAILASADWELSATISRRSTVDGVEAFTDINSMLESRPDIECVSLCMPPVPRFEYAKAAILAGRHVMLEKPPGATIAECKILETLAREAGVSIYATWHSREAEFVDATKSWLADKQIRKLNITWKEDVRRWHPGQKWIWEGGGLGVFDPGINALSILTKILPMSVHLSKAKLSFPENCDTPIAAKLSFYEPHGAKVSAEFDFRQEGEQIWAIAIDTNKGELLLEEGGAKLTIDGALQPKSTASKQELDASINPFLGGEYDRLYSKMAGLIRSRKSDMDLSPFVMVADAFMLGERETVEPFIE
ncbi:MAG: Gfo/Idh/MocA family protein [Nitratireductor sp.]